MCLDVWISEPNKNIFIKVKENTQIMTCNTMMEDIPINHNLVDIKTLLIIELFSLLKHFDILHYTWFILFNKDLNSPLHEQLNITCKQRKSLGSLNAD